MHQHLQIIICILRQTGWKQKEKEKEEDELLLYSATVKRDIQRKEIKNKTGKKMGNGRKIGRDRERERQRDRERE